MPSLTDKLKALGVQTGTEQPPAQPGAQHPIEEVVPGRTVETPSGLAFRVEQCYPIEHRHGCASLHIAAPLQVISQWASEPRLDEMDAQGFAFLDAETTGLARGTGTYAFVIGVGRYEGDAFHVAQFFMRDPSEELALLDALQAFLAPCTCVVTFNGKTFDLPLLQARCIANGRDCLFSSMPHLDLLSLARRLWRTRLPSRAMACLETQILDVRRTGADVPGWMIPDLYFDYLRDGDARPLAGIFYHNAVDVLSMVTLLGHAAALLADPLGPDVHPLDQVDAGRLFEDLGHVDRAAQLYERALAGDMPPEGRAQATRRWSFLEKRRDNLEAAMALWHQAATAGEVYAHVELAKVYEHRTHNLQGAAFWTQLALDRIGDPGTPRAERLRWADVLTHRLARLQRKLGDNAGNDA